VWSRARPAKGDCKLRGFEQEEKAIVCGKVKRKKKEHEALGEEDEIESEVPDDEVEGCGQAERMSCKDGKMGSGCCKFRKEGEDRRARVGREEEGASSNLPELGGVVLALQSAALSED